MKGSFIAGYKVCRIRNGRLGGLISLITGYSVQSPNHTLSNSWYKYINSNVSKKLIVNTGKMLVQQNITYLEQGERLVKNIGSDYYARLSIAESLGTIGSHYRHVLDMYRCFLQGIDQGIIRYDHRNRNKNIEKSAQIAIEESNRLISGLKKAATLTNSEDAIAVQRSIRGNKTLQLPTSVGRELDVLTSHTVHHYAIIALILNSHGVEYQQNFGVAPSTLEYRNDDKT